MNIISARIPNPIAGSVKEKLSLLRRLKLHHLALSYEDTPLESMPPNDVIALRDLLIDEGCFISLYEASPSLRGGEQLNTLLRNCHLLDIDSILYDLASFSSAEAESCLKASAYMGIVPLVENRAGSALADADAIMAFFEQHADVPCGLLFNPLEFVKTGRHPFFHVYYASRLKGRIAGLRINDGLYRDGSPTLPGHGNGEVKELMSIMKARSFRGFYAISPYMPMPEAPQMQAITDWLRETLKSI